MKALTISQPFASLILTGEKWVENRQWGTDFRGPLAIHAGKGQQYLNAEQLAGYPTGCVIAIARLAICMRLSWLRRRRSLVSNTPIGWCKIIGTDLTIGDVLKHKHTAGPWCWILTDVHGIECVPCRGHQGLWDWAACRVCGCTEEHACFGRSGEPCHWVEEDLCSRCAGSG